MHLLVLRVSLHLGWPHPRPAPILFITLPGKKRLAAHSCSNDVALGPALIVNHVGIVVVERRICQLVFGIIHLADSASGVARASSTPCLASDGKGGQDHPGGLTNAEIVETLRLAATCTMQ